MIEKVWAIKSREEKVASNGNKYLLVVVAGDDGKDHKQTFYEQGMWAVFQNNDYVKVTLDKPEGATRWEVKGAVAVTDELPKAKEPAPLLPEHQKVIDEAGVEKAHELVQEALATPPPAPQAVGMMTKEIGDMIRAKYLKTIFGEKIAIGLMHWYQQQALSITRIEFDTKDLPDFEKTEGG